MLKFKNSFIYVLCLLIAVLFLTGLVTGFYIMKKDDTNALKSEKIISQSSADNNTQNTTIIDNQNYSTTKHNLSQETQETDVFPELEYLYKVTLYEDSVAVFLYGKDKPYIKLYVDLRSIPNDDKELLKEGIYAKTKAELIRILEDYDS